MSIFLRIKLRTCFRLAEIPTLSGHKYSTRDRWRFFVRYEADSVILYGSIIERFHRNNNYSGGPGYYNVIIIRRREFRRRTRIFGRGRTREEKESEKKIKKKKRKNKSGRRESNYAKTKASKVFEIPGARSDAFDRALTV